MTDYNFDEELKQISHFLTDLGIEPSDTVKTKIKDNKYTFKKFKAFKNEETKNKELTIIGFSELEQLDIIDKIKNFQMEFKVIPNGYWLNELNLKITNQKFHESTKLKDFRNSILKSYAKEDHIQIFNKECVPLIINDYLENLTIGDLELEDKSILFIDFLPQSFSDDSLYKLSDHSFFADSFWNAPVNQSDLSRSIMISSLKCLQLFFLNEAFIGFHGLFHSVLKTYIPFSPAVTAVHHLFSSEIFNFERLIISRTLYYWIKSIFKTAIDKNENVFFFMPYLIVEIFKNIDLSDSAQKEIADTFFTYDHFHNLKQRLSIQRLIEKSVIRIWQKQKPKPNELERFKGSFTFLLSPYNDTKGIVEIAKNVQNIDEIKEYLINHQYLRIFGFAAKEIVEKNVVSNCLSIIEIDRGKEAVVILQRNCGKKYSESKEKILKERSFEIFGSLSSDKVVLSLDRIANKVEIENLKLPTIEEGVDTRPIEQIDCLILDISGSMQESIPCSNKANDDNICKLTVAVDELTYFIDKLYSYGFRHAVGILKFNDTVEVTSKITPEIEHIDLELYKGLRAFGGTALFDAITKAVELIKDYEESLKEKYEKYKIDQSISLKLLPKHKRILCFTDGGECSSYMSNIDKVADLLKKEGITLDTVCALPTYKCKEFRDFQAFAKFTDGYCLWANDWRQLQSYITSEAFIQLKQRQKEVQNNIQSDVNAFKQELQVSFNNLSHQKVKIKKIEGINSKAIKITSTDSQNQNQTQHQNQNLKTMSRMKRIIVEMKLIQGQPKDLDFPYDVYFNESDVSLWKAIYSPQGNNYAGFHWLIIIKFPDEFPHLPPEVRFDTPIYHPNINSDGRICHEILKQDWTPLTKITAVLVEINVMINEPNEADFMERDAAALYADYKKKKNEEGFTFIKEEHEYYKEIQKWNKDKAFKTKEDCLKYANCA